MSVKRLYGTWLFTSESLYLEGNESNYKARQEGINGNRVMGN